MHAAVSHALLVGSAVALGIMTVVSLVLGWIVAGRVLRPLREMTAATQRISEENLHERLAMPGPGDELKDLADTIDGLLERLEGAFAAQRRFVANASHELRTPLTTMRACVDVAVAKPEPVPAQTIDLAGRLRTELDRVDQLLDGFLVLARAQHGDLPGQATLSLEYVVSAALAVRAEAIAARKLTVHHASGRDGTWVRGSQALLCRMVDNVIDNAIGHNTDGGWISAATGSEGRLALPGGGNRRGHPRPPAGRAARSAVPAAPRRPDRFGRRRRARAVDRGGHRLGPSRHPGPAGQAGRRPACRHRAAAGHRGRTGGCPGMRVLVVEDSRSLADVLAEGLRDQGMAVDAAHDGLEAAAKLELNAYDVVVLDRDLPGIHGDTLCQMITERDDRVMVLMLTAASAPGERVSGLGLGADDYLAKPFHFPELVARICSLARRQPSARGRILRTAGIELDPLRHTVTRDGRQLHLSVKEFAVLEALLRAAPAFLSAESLLEQAWDEHADPFTNTVTVTIGRLRRKLGDPPVITTTPGVGYRIAGQPGTGQSE